MAQTRNARLAAGSSAAAGQTSKLDDVPISTSSAIAPEIHCQSEEAIAEAHTYPSRVKSLTTEPGMLARLHHPPLVPALIETGSTLRVNLSKLIDVDQRAPWVGATTIITFRLPLAGAALLRRHFELNFPNNSFQVLVGHDQPYDDDDFLAKHLDISWIGTAQYWVWWKPSIGNMVRAAHSSDQTQRLLGPEDTLTAQQLLERCIELEI